MLANRQTSRQTDMLMTILRSPDVFGRTPACDRRTDRHRTTYHASKSVARVQAIVFVRCSTKQRGGGGDEDVRRPRSRRRQEQETFKFPRSDRQEHFRPGRWLIHEHRYRRETLRGGRHQERVH